VTVVDSPLVPSQMPRLGELPDRLTVEITRHDILDGSRTSGSGCAVALAVKRTVRQLGLRGSSWEWVTVTKQDVEVSIDGMKSWIRYEHDGAAFIQAFDNDDRVQPCTLNLWRVTR
jgi:hypothetical protein